MHTAATALSHLPPEEWAGWIAYLCETLEQSSTGQTEEDLDATLEETIYLLQERLESGRW
jgi:predicted RNase H-like HicB family nuclease